MLPIVWIEGHRKLDCVVAPHHLQLVDDLQVESGFLARAKVAKFHG